MTSDERLEIGYSPIVGSVYPLFPPTPSDNDHRVIPIRESEFYTGGELLLSGLRDIGPEHLKTAVGVTSLANLLRHHSTRSGVLLPDESTIVSPTSEFHRLIGRHPYNKPDREITERTIRELYALDFLLTAEAKPGRPGVRKLVMTRHGRFLQSYGEVRERHDLEDRLGHEIALPTFPNAAHQRLTLFEPSRWLWNEIEQRRFGVVDLYTLRHLRGRLAITLLTWIHGRAFMATAKRHPHPWFEITLGRLRELFPLPGEPERYPSRYQRQVEQALREIRTYSDLLAEWSWREAKWKTMLTLYFNSSSRWYRKQMPDPALAATVPRAIRR